MERKKVVRHYSAGYPFETREGSEGCDCVEVRSEAKHVLEGTVRVGDAPKLQKAAARGAAVPYFPVASTEPETKTGMHELVRGSRGKSTLPGLFVVGDPRRKRRPGAAEVENEAPPLVVLGNEPGKRRRQRRIKSLDQLEAVDGHVRIGDALLSKDAWQSVAEVLLLGRCLDHTVEKDGELRVHLQRANLCSVPLALRSTPRVHFTYPVDPSTGRVVPLPEPEPPEGLDDAALLTAMQIRRLEQVVNLLLPKDVLARYKGAQDQEGKLEVLEEFLSQQRTRFNLDGD